MGSATDILPETAHEYGAAVLRGLNKITAETSEIVVKKEMPMAFGNLEITLYSCWASPPTEQPEAKALLEITEQRPSEEKARIFYGWMFMSSPGLNALEHPVYDIVLLGCEQALDGTSNLLINK
ncbi:MAG: DUF2155 domain-containing protein [Rickettsiales bacterium]|nr:DUF2155 domain-containing protein [Rickettsiales bacterium]